VDLMVLKLGSKLSLPLDFVTKTAAILAQRRKGKTYLASVIAEELVKAKQPFVALDPTGAWWGLRASADGTREGLPVVVLGGQHGDVPLERTGGRLIADLVVEAPGYYVIDFSLFESGEAERQFAIDFGERLYRAKGQPGKDFPLHLFVDEADRFVPQQLRKGSNETNARLLGAFEAIVRRGGLRGLGTTLISQRAAVVNKNVLEMLDILFVLRTTGPNDRAAIGGYLDAHGTADEKKALLDSLASLDIGEAWVWEPGADPPLFQRTQIRLRTTFNSSATPKHGETRVEPQRLAAVDLAKLQTRMAATIEKAKADDPRELRKQLAELRAEVANLHKKGASSPTTAADDAPARDKRIAQLEESLKKLKAMKVENMQRVFEALHKHALAQSDRWAAQELKAREWLDRLAAIARQPEHPPTKGDGRRVVPSVTTARPVSVPAVSQTVGYPGHQAPKRPVPPSGGNGAGVKLGGGERKVLTALAQYPEGRTKKQIGILAVYAIKGGRFTNILGALRTGGYIEGRDVLKITEAGLAALGDWTPLPHGSELLAYWRGQLQPSEARVLEVIANAWPNGLSKEELAAATDPPYEPSGGRFGNILGRLRGFELISGPREPVIKASDYLFD
jgi:hypothetical protein